MYDIFIPFLVKSYASTNRSVNDIFDARTKENLKFIGQRYGKIIKINKDENLATHGFISNDKSDPIIYFDVSLRG